jgi:deoxyadenosine/deoxycytidine kinase
MLSKNNVFIISIEGNIGSGKSTFLESLKQNKKYIYVREPVDEWETIVDGNGKTMLEKFYADQEKYSFSFQIMAFISRLGLLKRTIEKAIIDRKNPTEPIYIITERSLYTDKYVFCNMLFDNGKIEDVNYLIYLKWFEEFTQDYPLHKIIYIKTDPEICHERIAKRARQGETVIPLEYLKECDKYHETMLEIIKNTDVTIYTIDGNKKPEELYTNKILCNFIEDTPIEKTVFNWRNCVGGCIGY